MKLDHQTAYGAGALLKGKSTFLLFCILWIALPAKSLIPNNHTYVSSMSKPIHVYCLCQNQWVNGQVKNLAEVELRDGTSFGPVVADADVLVNGKRLAFDWDTQAYEGSMGKVEQWQRIPIKIATRDGRTITGYVAVVFLVEFVIPRPWTEVPPSLPLPLKWEYSEGSMHTVVLVIRKDDEELRSFEIPGNSTTIDFRQLRANLQKDDVVHIQIYPPWTSNYDFQGYTTKRSKAEFVTTAVISVKITGNFL